MAKVIGCMGESGSGKTTAMRNLPPDKTLYCDCDKKGLNWKGWRKQYSVANKAKVIRNNISRMKKAMYESMLQTGIRKVKGKRFTVSVQKNGGKAPFVLTWDNPDTLPDNLVERKPNIEAIRAVTEKGDTTYGYIAERGESLRIK